MVSHSERQFDAVADTYATEEFPIKTWVESPTFYRVIGDLKDRTVLDMGCGNGLYSRSIKSQGARQVFGFDISPEMIRVARQFERQDPCQIEYAVHDATNMPRLGLFDDVVAINVLHYANNHADLAAMMRNAAQHLHPGGRFTALVHNADYENNGYASRKYGYEVHMPLIRRDGEKITMEILAGDGLPTRGSSFTIHFQYYQRRTYEAALRLAGFRDISWHRFDTATSTPENYPPDFWQEAVANPYSDILHCRI
ncbi:class I SAM-dependent methyltransferase [Streptomyces collinus]|uniref:class I SAM-dependent methyltransferase n=1 Tax=Streptomyces collinus TaxID=42684 RepID=UPI0036CA7674